VHAPERPAPLAPGGVEEIGCARVVTSRDGRARVWTPLRERWAGSDEGDRGGTGVRRGLAFLQVKGDEGPVRVLVDRARGEDLHLDATVDAIEPAPEPGLWLVLGLRAYDAKGASALPRRYALLVEADRAGGLRLARGRFELDRARRDVLLLQSPAPSGGELRSHALAARPLEWSAEDASLRLARPGGARTEADARQRPAVAIWTGSLFRVLGRSWDGRAERPGDARIVLADRWGAADELGPRPLDEIAVARRAAEPSRAQGGTARARAPGDGRPAGGGVLAAAGEPGR
jgi:hypothetical protein